MSENMCPSKTKLVLRIIDGEPQRAKLILQEQNLNAWMDKEELDSWNVIESPSTWSERSTSQFELEEPDTVAYLIKNIVMNCGLRLNNDATRYLVALGDKFGFIFDKKPWNEAEMIWRWAGPKYVIHINLNPDRDHNAKCTVHDPYKSPLESQIELQFTNTYNTLDIISWVIRMMKKYGAGQGK